MKAKIDRVGLLTEWATSSRWARPLRISDEASRPSSSLATAKRRSSRSPTGAPTRSPLPGLNEPHDPPFHAVPARLLVVEWPREGSELPANRRVVGAEVRPECALSCTNRTFRTLTVVEETRWSISSFETTRSETTAACPGVNRLTRGAKVVDPALDAHPQGHRGSGSVALDPERMAPRIGSRVAGLDVAASRLRLLWGDVRRHRWPRRRAPPRL
jgi:hypothetical protein